MSEIPTTLLFFICMIQGTQNVLIDHKESLTVTLGENLALPCIVAEMHDININQLEWRRAEQKLVVFNPAYPVHYGADVKLQLINRTDTAKVQGSILHLSRVSKKDTGNYVCEITTFPNGSIKRATSVQVVDPEVLMEVMPASDALVEGDMVNITCVSFPPAGSYRLTSTQSNLSLESQDGGFTIQNITRHIRDLICWPLWGSSHQHLQGQHSSKPLSVYFLDSIECSSSSHIQVDTGANLTITCEAKSSRPLHYVWKKGNLIVSSDVTLSLWSVNTSSSGIYTLTVNARNHSRLHRQRNFTVIVLDRTHTERMETSQISLTTLATAKSGPTIMTSQSVDDSSTAYSNNTAKGLYIETISPPAGNITTLQANVTALRLDMTTTATTSANSSREGCCEWQNTTSSSVSPHRGFTHAHSNTSTVTSASESKPAFTPFTKKSKQTHNMVYVLIPLLFFLVLIGVLYRRYIIQKRMDLPPPFKPPPPPVKYTSVQYNTLEPDGYSNNPMTNGENNIAMTDIFV